MRNRFTVPLLVLLGAVLFQHNPVLADPPPVPLMAANCGGCHGVEGRSPGSIPSLAGRTADELAALLMEFKSGERPSTIMGRIITPFGDEEIHRLADYFSALPKAAATARGNE
jgi:sulfide dehydrogenase cytochrome subunit